MLNKKALLSAALILGAASAALANGLDVSPGSVQSASGHPRQAAEMLAANHGVLGSARNTNAMIGHERTSVRRPNASTCPWLEGYPDCHPDSDEFQSRE